MNLLGSEAPEFTLENTAGKQVTLSETLEHGPTIIVMFRAAWCSFCAEQLRTFSDISYDLWYNHDTDIIPVSSDSIPNLTEMRDRYALTIQLCSDPEFTVTKEYTEAVPHEWRPDYTRAGTFLIDTDGIIRYEHIAESAADRTYANYLRYYIKRGFDDHYDGVYGKSL